MAINPSLTYPSNTANANANYPYGSARNDLTSNDGTGTPLEASWVNDFWGIQQALYTRAGIAPNNTPETALVCQFLDALDRTMAGTVLVSAFVGDGNGNVTSQLQACEDYASNNNLKVCFDVICNITSSIIKKPNSIWIQSTGGIQRLASHSGNAFPLVLCQNINGFNIDGIFLKNAKIGQYTQASSTIENLNALIAIEGCKNFKISNIKGENFSQGIFYSDCNNFIIDSNILNADSSNNITEQDYEDGTYTPNANISGSGGIISSQQLGVLTPASTFYCISNNVINAFGIDAGIDAVSNSFTRNPSVISNNIVHGGHVGIQIYQGALADNGTATTYQRSVSVVGNNVSYQWDQNIYLRLSFGCVVSGNICRKGNMNGDLTAGGTPFGGIVTRISQNNFTVTSPVTADIGNLIIGNVITDIGRDIVGCMAGVQIRTEATRCVANTIGQSEELSYSKIGVGIRVADDVHDFEVFDNRVTGFNQAIRIENADWGFGGIGRIQRNYCHNSIDGIVGQNANGQVLIEDNLISDCTGDAITLRFAPKSTIKRNKIENCGTGINLSQGNYYTDINNRSSARVGASLEICDNSINNTNTSHSVSQTTGTDALFYGRCKIWRGDTVDGLEVSNRSTTGFPSITATKKSWNKGDLFYNSNIQPSVAGEESALIGSVCTSQGTYGILVGVSGTTTSGSNIVTVNDSDSLAEGVYININGVTGIKKIVSIDGVTVTIDSNADASLSGASISYAIPVFDRIETVGEKPYAENLVTISSGEVEILSSARIVELNIDTENGDPIDDLTNIVTAINGQIVICRQFNFERNINFIDGVGNLRLQGDFYGQTSTANRLVLIYDGTNWHELSRSYNNFIQRPIFTTQNRDMVSGVVDFDNIALEVRLTIQTEGSGTEDLNTINNLIPNLFSGQRALIRRSSSGGAIILKDGIDNLRLNLDCTLASVNDRIMLEYDGANWIELYRSINS